MLPVVIKLAVWQSMKIQRKSVWENTAVKCALTMCLESFGHIGEFTPCVKKKIKSNQMNVLFTDQITCVISPAVEESCYH